MYTLFPLLWLVISSFKTNYELLTDPFSLPAVWQIGNYINALTVAGLGRMLINSVLVGLGATALNVIIASMSAYCISRFRFKGREKFYGLFTAGILIPLNALMVPYFVIINKLGLYDTYGGMILLYTAIGIPMSTFLIRGLMDSIPMELEEAAYIDGCGFFARFWHIILPLSRTGIVTAATFEFLTCWNEFGVRKPHRIVGKAAHDPSRHTLLHQPVLDRLRLHVRGDRHFDNPLHPRLRPLPRADNQRHDQRRGKGVMVLSQEI